MKETLDGEPGGLVPVSHGYCQIGKKVVPLQFDYGNNRKQHRIAYSSGIGRYTAKGVFFYPACKTRQLHHGH